jgi:hypothetical protein
MRLLRVTKIPDDFPIATQTLYRWHHEGRFPHLFKKIGGTLCLDMDKFEDAAQNDEMEL